MKAVFLDRDGVLNKPIIINGKPYPPKSTEELIIIEGVKEGLNQLRQYNYLLIVITNQPDIARGITTINIVDDINNNLKQQLSIDDIYCCIHDDSDNCSCRKPKPGMIFEAAKKWNINLNSSFLIGDRGKDIEAGTNAGLKTLLIDYNYQESFYKPDYICSNFLEAVHIIISLT
jgi:D-glycero-D-manno-heptose 1,7-bisphosphate phosphatase